MDIYKELNEEQARACASTSQFLRIIAGAGTGKTRTLTYRLAYQILSGTDPRRMVAFTFTNKAAKEMKDRTLALLKREGIETGFQPQISTFHSFCYRFLRKEISHIPPFTKSFQIADEKDLASIFKDIFAKMTKGTSKEFCKDVQNKISSLKNDGYTSNDIDYSMFADKMHHSYTFDELLYAFQHYETALRRQNLLDFDDLLIFTVKIMKSDPELRNRYKTKYDTFLIDEFQDTNYIQYEIAKLFMSSSAQLTVVGDPDQTIYTWRGAKDEIILDLLKRDYPSLETVILNKNYRSTTEILNAANSLISHNFKRMKKDLISAENISSDPVKYTNYYSANQEAVSVSNQIQSLISKGIKRNDIAIIYRSNYLSNALEHALSARGIPYVIYGGMKFYERAEIKDAIAYLRLIVNPDDFSFKRVLKAPSKGIGQVTLEKAEALEGDDLNSSLFCTLRNNPNLKINSTSKALLDQFYKAYDKFNEVRKKATTGEEISAAVLNYFNETGFMRYIEQEDKKLVSRYDHTGYSSENKSDNVRELLREMREFFETDLLDEDGNTIAPTLEDYLINVALQSDQDAMDNSDRVNLMTGHVSKGLEFPYVFLIGMNQFIFPTSHALQSESESGISEERRLCYVCMTRAKKALFVSSYEGQDFRGNPFSPSQFIKEAGLISSKKEAKTNSVNPSYKTQQSKSVNFLNFADIKNRFAQPKPKMEDYKVGDIVIHTSFGKGEILGVSEDKVDVKFAPEYGTKRLKKSFSGMRKITGENDG